MGTLQAVTNRPHDLSALSRRLPEWCDEGTDSSLRDTEEDQPASREVSVRAISSGSGIRGPGKASPVILTPARGPSPVGSLGGKGVQWRDLDEFYAENSEHEEEEDDDSDEDSEDSKKDGEASHVNLRESESDEESEGDEDEESDEGNHR